MSRINTIGSYKHNIQTISDEELRQKNDFYIFVPMTLISDCCTSQRLRLHQIWSVYASL